MACLALIPLVIANLSSYSSHYPDFPRDQLDSFIARNRLPTPSLSSLRDLAATSSAYNPPSPLCRPTSPVDTDPLNLSLSSSRPIPIPRRSIPALDDRPVTPLTGRFDKGYYFPPTYRTPEKKRGKHKNHRNHSSLPKPPSTMRSDHPTFYSPAASPTMSPSGRPASPQQPRRSQNPSKSVPTFHLGNLPRFHPAVYQSSAGSHSPTGPSSPRLSRQNNYRPSASARDTMWQYREAMENKTMPRTPPVPLSPGPSAPRLDPLRSPGPVTPLALEESGGYFGAGAKSSDVSRDKPQSGGQDLVEMLIARESERARQKAKVSGKR